MGKIFYGIKYVYKKIPISKGVKVRLKDVFYSTFGFCLKSNSAYKEWKYKKNRTEVLAKQSKEGCFEFDVKEAENFRFMGKLAVQLHLFYVDLLEEFIGYFNHIPYGFDLYISIVHEEKSDYVKNKCTEIANVEKIVVKTVENRGRDVAPLISVFGKDILEYDYFCHIHSKKSLFMGNEQMDWRKHLMDNLMGSDSLVRSILYCFEKGDKVGMIYPETFSAMPYWGHTWLQNAGCRDELLGRIGVPYINAGKYIDYPMGTMFWGRVDALKQFFAAEIAVNEFAKENGQTDGTIAHAFERCTGVVCHHNEYNILIYDPIRKLFTYNNGRKNFEQYYVKSFDKLEAMAADFEIVSFDIFDTLVSRKVARPSDAFALLEAKLKLEYELEIPFVKWREEAECLWRTEHKGMDCDLNDIYEVFEKLSGLDKKECELIKNAEVENELALIEPKAGMAALFNKIAEKKDVILISDMYLRREDLVKLLDKCNINNYKEILLSNELNLRKADKTLWIEYAKKCDTKKWLHVGDNETSDIQISGDYGITAFHILNTADLFACSNIGSCYQLSAISNPQTSVAAGLVLNKLFDEPFRWNDSMLDVKISDVKEYGYTVLAPAVLGYMNHLYRKLVSTGVKEVLFFAREGHLLKELFDLTKEYLPSLSDVKGIYLNVSRRALSVPSLKTGQDIAELLELFFEGSFRELLLKRFGIEVADASAEEIFLPRDKEKVLSMIKTYEADILKRAAWEREHYLQYYNAVRAGRKERAAVSDIGYSGTIQYYLSKVTGETYDGYYFATNQNQRALLIEGNTTHGYYIEEDENQRLSRSVVNRYHLLLESVLIAPVGQFLYVDEEGNNVYAQDKNVYYTDGMKAVHEGIKAYFRDFYQVCGETALYADVDKEFAEQMLLAAVEKEIEGVELEKLLKFEDSYCSDGDVTILEFYRNNEQEDEER